MIFSQYVHTNPVTVRTHYYMLHGLSQGPQRLNFPNFMVGPPLQQIQVSSHNLKSSGWLLVDYSEWNNLFCVAGTQGIVCCAGSLIDVLSYPVRAEQVWTSSRCYEGHRFSEYLIWM